MARGDHRQPTPSTGGLVIRSGAKGPINLLSLLRREVVMGITLDIDYQMIDQGVWFFRYLHTYLVVNIPFPYRRNYQIIRVKGSVGIVFLSISGQRREYRFPDRIPLDF